MAKVTPQGNVDRVARELQSVLERVEDDGVQAECVVEWARKHANSALHGCFTWDDGEAAHQFRLSQARRLIKVSCVRLPRKYTGEGIVIVHPAFTSLPQERGKDGRGYLPTVKVLDNPTQKRLLLIDTINRIWSIKEFKNRLFPELEGVYRELQKVRDKYLENDYSVAAE